MAEQPDTKWEVRKRLVQRRRGPTFAELRSQAEGALRAEKGPDLGPLSHDERNKILFGQ